MKKDLGIDMVTTNGKNKLEKLPTLDQVLLVEDTLQNFDDSVITLSQLKKRLSIQLKNNTLLVILDYLAAINKIVVTPKGITWIYNTNPRLQKAIDEGLCL
jgi:hypothetical protein